MQFSHTGTELSMRLSQPSSAVTDLLHKLHTYFFYGNRTFQGETQSSSFQKPQVTVPPSRNYKCQKFISIFFPSLFSSPENKLFWGVGGVRILSTALTANISPKSFVSASSAVFSSED